MDYRAVFQVSASGMDVEKLRLDTAALNLANMETSSAPGAAPYKPLRVVSQPLVPSFQHWMSLEDLARAGGVAHAAVVETNAPPRIVHDPADPHADAKGDVHYPGVDHTGEMQTVMSALRAYEANVAALGAAKAMATHALEIGGQS
jgi:flagellar basal-body rod protein FlgC